ncbi:lipopolysaccharide heptosyltransferase I [soil metagenome]
MKILIVKLSSIGDIVHTLPALAAIRRELPDAEISWAVESRSAEILRGSEFLKNLIEVDTRSLRGGKVIEEILLDAGRQIKDLRVSDFDIAVDFQGLLKSATIAKLSKAKKRFGFDKENLREPMSRFLLTGTVKIENGIHVVRKNLALAEKALSIKVPTDNFEFPIFTSEEHKREAEQIIEQTGEDFAILNPAGGWETKLWQAEKFGELADRLWMENRLFSIVTTAPNEKDLAERVLQAKKTGKIFHASPTLKGFYELAKRARVYIGGDTGPTHLAVAANAPVVGIFGPTEWWFNGSPNPNDICVGRTDLECRINCNRRKIGSWKKGECGNWLCLEIAVETVFDAVQTRLKTVSKI